MTSIIRLCLLSVLLALPAMANATFFKQHHNNSFSLGDHQAFSWTRAGDAEEPRHRSLKHFLAYKTEQRQPAWGQWGHHEPRLKLPELIFGIASFFKHIDLKSRHHNWDWSRCKTTEVPVPATLPLFSFALLSLGLFKRRRLKA